jgi:hypothetical protein
MEKIYDEFNKVNIASVKKNNKSVKEKNIFTIFFYSFGISIIFFLIVFNIMKNNKQPDINPKNIQSSNQVNSCIGNENCISKVRERFKNTGKNILGEEYIGNGIFGISFIDDQYTDTYNAKVSTDCNCNVINIDVSIVH